MPGPKRFNRIMRDRKRRRPESGTPSGAAENIEIYRTLRRDFGLTSAEISKLDIDLAIEAGLLSRAARPKR